MVHTTEEFVRRVETHSEHLLAIYEARDLEALWRWAQRAHLILIEAKELLARKDQRIDYLVRGEV